MKIRPALVKSSLAAACCMGGFILFSTGPAAWAGPAASGAPAQLTFPPVSDCAFLGGEAGQRCEARRAGQASEVNKVRSGDLKLAPAPVASSGGTFQPLSTGGGLGGLSESSTIAPAEAPAAPAPSYNPNSIGNPWAGTPYSNGTGIPPR